MQNRTSPQSSSRCICLLVLLLTATAICTSAKPQRQNQSQKLPRFDQLVASAEKGDASSQVELGILYYQGMADSPRPDYDEAMKWFQRAADQGNAKAQDRIGLMYYSGKGVPQDFAQAAHWYQLAAEGGELHAQLQLSDMYQRGLGVPRDLDESRKWARQASASHPDHSTSQIRAVFAVAVLLVIAFTFGLIALQRNVLTGWQHLAVAIPVHFAGIALVLNTLVTYGFWIVFPHCSHNFLATACTQIEDPHTRSIVNGIGDFAVVNLIFRFMAGVGLVLDALAIWYVVYIFRLLFIKRPHVQTPRPVPSRSV